MTDTLNIRIDDLTAPEVVSLLEQHLALMFDVTPKESVHALDLEALRAPDITFWTAWQDGELLGCGALKELSSDHGEIKSMHTAARARGKGIGAAILVHIMEEARHREYERLSLETGTMDAFAPARGLYEKHGFYVCGPFGSYTDDPNSVFMTRII